MTTFIITLTALLLATAFIGYVVHYVRLDLPRGGSPWYQAPRSHPADAFERHAFL